MSDDAGGSSSSCGVYKTRKGVATWSAAGCCASSCCDGVSLISGAADGRAWRACATEEQRASNARQEEQNTNLSGDTETETEGKGEKEKQTDRQRDRGDTQTTNAKRKQNTHTRCLRSERDAAG